MCKDEASRRGVAILARGMDTDLQEEAGLLLQNVIEKKTFGTQVMLLGISWFSFVGLTVNGQIQRL